jgi:nucleoside-diphosphate-sugar epimerase
MRVLIAGCGYVGTELGLRLAAAEGFEVWGLRRRVGALPPGIRPIPADLLDAGLAGRLPVVDRVVYAAAADASTPERYRDAYVRGTENLLAALQVVESPADRFIFVSSTAVYGDAEGEWVDESTAPSPESFRGAEVLEGERTAIGGSVPAVVLRLGGIYGPGRTRLIDRVRSGEARCSPGPPVWSNRIHRDDAAGALLHLLTLPATEPVYLGVDDEPSPICDVYRYVASLVGAPAPAVDPREVSERPNKRCSNRRLRASGFEFAFPTYREGYRAIVRG